MLQSIEILILAMHVNHMVYDSSALCLYHVMTLVCPIKAGHPPLPERIGEFEYRSDIDEDGGTVLSRRRIRSSDPLDQLDVVQQHLDNVAQQTWQTVIDTEMVREDVKKASRLMPGLPLGESHELHAYIVRYCS